MPTLTPTQTATLYLDAFDSVALNCDTSGSGSVAFTSGGRNLRSDATESLKAKTYGPYGVPGILLISVTGGSVSYSVSRPIGANSVPRILAQSAIPFILPSSGSIGNNGALSGITALPTTYSGGCWMYFPANAIVAGSTAGWYWTVMSSSTAGTIYNSTYTSGTNFVGTATAFATTGPGAYTQTTSAAADISAAIVTVPGGSLGPNGTLELLAQFVVPNNANAKPVAIRESGTSITTSTGLASTGGNKYWWTMQNRNNQAVNVGQTGVGALATGNASNYLTRNTAADTTWAYSFEIATATDYVVMEKFEVRVNYGA